MNVLGVIGSARKLGNGEILVKKALMAAKAEGATVRAIRLADYRLLPCKGCLACVLKGEACRLDDDMHALWGHFQWADAIILSTPTYFLGPSGIVKLLIDRLFEYSLSLGQIPRRPAAIIATAGLREWDPLTIPMLTMLAGVLQLDIIDKFTAYRPGPGEVLLDEHTLLRAATIGTKIVQAIKQPSSLPKLSYHPNHCPHCGTFFFRILKGTTIECTLCQAKGQLQIAGNKALIEWDSEGGQNRWSPEALLEHFSEWVIKTGPVFQKYQAKIQELKKPYREFKIEPPPPSK